MVESDGPREANDALEETPEIATRAGPNRPLIGAIAGVAFLVFIAIFSWGLMNRSAATGASGSERPGDPAPEFSLATLDGSGTVVNLSDHLGQPIVLNFWASWCAPCRDEMPHFVNSFRANHESGVVFIAINVQDPSIADARGFVEEFEIPVDDGYILVRDTTGRTTISWGIGGLPATFFIDTEGIVLSRYVGGVNAGILEEGIALIRG